MRPATEGTRRLGLVCALAFAVSTAFPVVASLMNVAEMPRVLGIADVVMAVVAVATALTTDGRAGALVRDTDRRTAYMVIRAGSGAALVLLALFLIGRPHIKWDVTRRRAALDVERRRRRKLAKGCALDPVVSRATRFFRRKTKDV